MKFSTYTRYTDLPNGQVAMFRAVRTEAGHGFFPRERIRRAFEVWSLSVMVGDTRKACRMAFRGDVGRRRRGSYACNRSTGSCGLAGLRAIKQMLEEFQVWVVSSGKGVDILCYPFDEKRRRSYAYLLRMGYRWVEGEDGGYFSILLNGGPK